MCAKKGFESKSFNVDGEVGPYKDIRIDVEYDGADHYTMHLQYKGGPGSPAKQDKYWDLKYVDVEDGDLNNYLK